MSVYFCFSFGSRTDHQSAKILVAPRLSRRGCSFRTRERWRLQNKRNAFIGRRARCSEDSSSSVSSASCSKPSGPRSGTWQNRKGRGVNSVIRTLHKDWDPVSWVEVRERHKDAHSCLQRPSIPSRQSTSKEFYIIILHQISSPHLMVQGLFMLSARLNKRQLPSGTMPKPRTIL